jgi:RimJ/RimL family protein N-acetyltransferase
VQLETERLILRVPEESDVDAWAEIYGHPDVTRFLGERSRADLVEHIRIARDRHAADGFGLLAVVRKEDDRVVGRAGLLVWDDRNWTPSTLRDSGPNAEIELGWAFNRDFWGLGYATESGAACRDYVFGELGRPRVIALIDPENDRSIAVAERLGLVHERDVFQLGVRWARLYAGEPGSRQLGGRVGT